MMHQKDGSSKESMSLEECERLVLSPPPVPIKQEDFHNFLCVNRTVSAKHSLHSVSINDNTPPLPRHVSIAWSKSEFDSKFKNYESQMKSTSVHPNSENQGSLASKHSSPTTLSDQINVMLVTTSAQSNASSLNNIQSVQQISTSELKKSRKTTRTSSWLRLFCCVSGNRKLNGERPTIISKDAKPFQQIAVPNVQSKNKIVGSTEASLKSDQPKKAKRRNLQLSKWFSGHNGNQDFSDTDRLTANNITATNKDSHLPISTNPNKIISHNADNQNAKDDENIIYLRDSNHQIVDDLDYPSSNGSMDSDDSYPDPVESSASPSEDLLGQIPSDCIGKKCLVLDLDETLVHSSFKASHYAKRREVLPVLPARTLKSIAQKKTCNGEADLAQHVDNANFSVIVEIDNMHHEVLVCKRPYLDEFIKEIGPLFECVMFTASLSKYADPVSDKIDPAGHLRHRLFREACVCFKGNYIKHLSVLGRDLDQICIIDNSPISFYFHRQNALQIVSWFDDQEDTALLDLIPYLKGMAAAPNVLDYMQSVSPPSTAAIAQPPPAPWLLLPPTDMNGYYEEDVGEGDEEDGQHQEAITSGINQVITMATRSGEPVAT